ncbi:MAG TPA: exodeoxyribonuclease VII small subunit [Pyrinomonadaceae bacterium]|jgi:exodeoxyribonuclease VII small subunit|nr:exodeoxyribonuclease VII small subunit [Pyrinomonadaceae bacterium]
MAKTFEASLNELEAIVRQLEDGDLPLEESLKLFENGVKLSRECRERLNNAERRIEILIKDANGDFLLEEIPSGSDTPDQPAGKRITFDDE